MRFIVDVRDQIVGFIPFFQPRKTGVLKDFPQLAYFRREISRFKAKNGVFGKNKPSLETFGVGSLRK